MSQAPADNSSGPAKSLRVCLVAAPRTLANLGPVVRHLVVGLLDEPMHVTIAYPAGADVAYVPAPPAQLLAYERPRLPWLRPASIRRLAEELKLAGTSLLHGLDSDALPITRRLAEEMDLDYLLSVMSMARDVRISDHHCRAVLAGSQPIRQMLLETRAAAGRNVELIRPGVHRAGRATCFIEPRHAPAIVAAGELRSYAPFAAVLEAFARLISAERDCAFFLVGSGHGERQLRRLAERLGMMGELTFVDRQTPEQLMGILRAADIFISPTASDRIEIEVLAAMAAGVPVLTADAKVSDFIIPGRTALTFKAGAASELAEKLIGLLDDRVSARSLAENGLALLRENHSPAKMAGRLAELYRSVAGRSQPALE
ncbi:MAG: hypothetical protein AMJ81_03230 [Phycisphaerae bacterium SM23_33]|nr:MAG: hypothetical protein AMJ81_03230 [Phycisphaerae bacterium SM23_33]